MVCHDGKSCIILYLPIIVGSIATTRLWSDSTLIYHMYQPMCSENATSLHNCNYSTTDTGIASCRSSSYDATSVLCLNHNSMSISVFMSFPNIHCIDAMVSHCEDGSVRLVGESSHRGRLEICKGNVWGSVCYAYYFSTADSDVVCRMLGQQPLGMI